MQLEKELTMGKEWYIKIAEENWQDLLISAKIGIIIYLQSWSHKPIGMPFQSSRKKSIHFLLMLMSILGTVHFLAYFKLVK